MIKEWLASTSLYATHHGGVRPRIFCKDGFSISVQASSFHYCQPRVILDDGEYDSVECGYPNMDVPEFHLFKDGIGVAACVPIDLVDSILESHGGILL